VHCGDDIGVTLGVASPLLEPSARLTSRPLSLVSHSLRGLSVWLSEPQF